MRNNLQRRHFLQGLGGLIALPLMESLMPRAAWGATAPIRYGLLYVPNGTIQNEWQPTGTGSTYTMPSLVAPTLNPIRNDFSWVTGLSNIAFNPNNPTSDPGHEAVAGGFLTQMRISGSRTPGAATTIDQLMAAKATTRLKSLTLVHSGQAVGCCESIWLNVISFANSTTPTARLSDPLATFNLLFPSNGTSGPSSADLVIAQKRSILDFSLAQQSRLSRTVSSSDNQRLQQYLDSVRAVEKTLVAATPPPSACTAPGTPPAANPNFTQEHQAMLDMMALAYQCDQTRVITYMMDAEFSNKNLMINGINSGHHDVSHYGTPTSAAAAQYRLIQLYYAQRFVYLVNKLKSLPDVDGKSVFDNSAILFGFGFRETNGTSHLADNIPLLLAGKAGGRLNPGQVVRPGNVPLSNLHRTLAEISGFTGTDIASFGGNTGTIAGL